MLVLLISIGVIWFSYHTYEKQYYRQFSQYSGKAKIDDYEMIRTRTMIEERIHATKQYVKALFADRADGHD